MESVGVISTVYVSKAQRRCCMESVGVIGTV